MKPAPILAAVLLVACSRDDRPAPAATSPPAAAPARPSAPRASDPTPDEDRMFRRAMALDAEGATPRTSPDAIRRAVDDYQRNALAAADTWEGRDAVFAGVVKRVGRSRRGDAPAVLLSATPGDYRHELLCELAPSEIEPAKSLSTGDRVRAIGRVTGRASFAVDAVDCLILPDK